jgi:hypothetical protein
MVIDKPLALKVYQFYSIFKIFISQSYLSKSGWFFAFKSFL